MNILDFNKSEEPWFSYDTMQKVWGEDIEINVVFDNAEDERELSQEDMNLRGVVRPLSEKLKFVEENRKIIEETVAEADIEGLTVDDLKSLYITWILFTKYVDTGEFELYLYLGFGSDTTDDSEIVVIINNDNTVTVDDLV